jgi:hypothetical protein
MSEIFTSLLCIELDCLLDTRLATLFLIDAEAAESVLRKGYLDRWTDDFPVKTELYEKVYRARDRKTLKNSIMTPMVRLCREFVHETLKQGTQGPYQYTPKIVINMYPYQLTDSEQETIVRVVATAVKQVCDIQIVSYDYDQLNPAWVKKECSVLVMYRYPEWLEYHSLNGQWKKTTCPEVTLMGPALYFNGPPSDAAVAESQALKMSPFEAMEQITGPLIQLTLLPVRYFSIAFDEAMAVLAEDDIPHA